MIRKNRVRDVTCAPLPRGLSGGRRARRRAALLEAGLELFGTRGCAGTTVRGVCTLAVLNDRYFYENFPDLDALLVAVFDEVARRGEEAILAAVRSAPRDLPLRVRAVANAGPGFLIADPRHARLLTHEIQVEPALRGRRNALIRRLAGIFTAQAHELAEDMPLSDTDVEMTVLTLVGGAMELVSTWLRGELAVDREHLIDFLVALIVTSDGLPASPARKSQAVRRAPA